MARIRTIKPEHWNDKKLAEISLPAHLLWIALWNFSDDEGIIESDLNLIRSQVFPRRTDIRTEQVEQWIGQLVKARFVIPFTYNGEGYLIHRTFKTHQKIDKPKDSKIPKELIIKVRNANQEPFDDSSATLTRKADEESALVEESSVEEGKVEESKPSPHFETNLIVYDAEAEILANQIRFEQICMKTGSDADHGKFVLHKYHLWLIEKNEYPRAKLSVYAGFEKWLLNEKKKPNGGNQQSASGDNGKLGTSAARVQAAKDF